MKKKALLLLLFVCFIFLNQSFSTPSASKWEREIFIGYNRAHYFTFMFISENPGSHYEGYRLLYIYKYDKKTRSLNSKILIRKTKLDSSYSGNRFKPRVNEYHNKSFNLTAYFMENSIVFDFPNHEDIDKYYIINKNGLYKRKNGKLTKLIDGKLFIKDHWAINHLPKILSIFSCDVNSYYVIRYGFGGDTGFYQNVVAVKNSL